MKKTMTDENEDSGQTLAGSEQPSSQKADAGVKQNSNSEQSKQVDLGERMERLEKMLSSFQSGKDRAIAGTKDELAELKVQFGEVQKLMKGKGLSEDEAFDELKNRKEDSQFRQAILEVRDLLKIGTSSSAQAGGVKIDPSVVDVLKQYPELDANDPDVVSKVLTLTDPKEAEYQALKLIRSRLTQATPSPSAASPMSGTPPTPVNESAKIARLAELQKLPSKNKAEIAKLEAELGWK
jgi:hypothetical protein